MEAVGQLTGGLAHEFNNLMTGIIGSLELMQMKLARGQEVGRFMEAAVASAGRAAALTNRLLSFSRRQMLNPGPTDVAALAASLEALIGRTMGPAITVEMHWAPGLWLALCDPGQLETALLNLCVNARDAVPEGGLLRVEAANAPLDAADAEAFGVPAGDYLRLAVADAGGGMPPEVCRRAFEPFFTTKPLGEGTGLGLSMVYGFARQSGGHAAISSREGEGTTIRLYLPSMAAEPEPPAAEALEEQGHAVLQAADGAAALRLLAEAPVDLLLTDVGLPGGMNGRQLADAARRRKPGLRVLFITGYAGNAAMGGGPLETGMQIMTKPFELHVLARRVAAMLSA
jgi:CheY-like chemotaxis protein